MHVSVHECVCLCVCVCVNTDMLAESEMRLCELGLWHSIHHDLAEVLCEFGANQSSAFHKICQNQELLLMKYKQKNSKL